MFGAGTLRTITALKEALGAELEPLLALHLVKGHHPVSFGLPMMKHFLTV